MPVPLWNGRKGCGVLTVRFEESKQSIGRAETAKTRDGNLFNDMA
jgi:hypothetical protein